MASENGGANFLVGFFVGAAMGAMGALLLAPKSGRELRESLVDESKRLRDRAVEEGRRARERSEELVGDVRSRGTAAYDKAREGLTETSQTAKKAAQGVKEVLTHPKA
jgi:gas vesicle protein